MYVVVVEVVVVVDGHPAAAFNLNLGCRSSSLICLVSMAKAMKNAMNMAKKKAMKMAMTKAMKKTEGVKSSDSEVKDKSASGASMVKALKAMKWVKCEGYMKCGIHVTQYMVWPTVEWCRNVGKPAKKPAMKAAMKATKKK